MRRATALGFLVILVSVLSSAITARVVAQAYPRTLTPGEELIYDPGVTPDAPAPTAQCSGGGVTAMSGGNTVILNERCTNRSYFPQGVVVTEPRDDPAEIQFRRWYCGTSTGAVPYTVRGCTVGIVCGQITDVAANGSPRSDEIGACIYYKAMENGRTGGAYVIGLSSRPYGPIAGDPEDRLRTDANNGVRLPCNARLPGDRDGGWVNLYCAVDGTLYVQQADGRIGTIAITYTNPPR